MLLHFALILRFVAIITFCGVTSVRYQSTHALPTTANWNLFLFFLSTFFGGKQNLKPLAKTISQFPLKHDANN